MQHKVPAVFMRGGTSRAICFREDDLAGYDGPTRERIILAALGSPDMHGRQVDGLGGGISSLSKVAIIGRSRHADSDVTFTFGQVDVRSPAIDWSSTCGNISAAVGPFAVDEGLVPALEPLTRVRVLATNTGKRYIAQVPVCDGQAEVEGAYTIDGVPAPGACIRLEYLEPGGSLGGELLPTGRPRQELGLTDGRHVSVSVVDAAIPTIFVRAEEVGADVRRLAPELDGDQSLQARLEDIRCRGAVLLGLAASPEDAHTHSPAAPKIALVASPADDPVEALLDPRVPVEIVVDVSPSGLDRNVQPLRQAERAEAVEDTEIHRLGHTPHVVVHRCQLHPENLHCGAGMDVLAAMERLDQHRVLAEMGQQPQFDLRVIHRHQAMAGGGDEGAANLAPQLRADRDVLQVGIAAAQAPGLGDRLVE